MEVSSTEQAAVHRPPLEGRVALVTGGTRGIGAAITHSLAAQGATVGAGYGRNHEAAQKFCAQAADEDLQVSIHEGDVGAPEDCRRTVDEVLQQHGRLDILVNNAGITVDKGVLDLSDEDWHKVLAVNLSGAFFMSQAALPHMIERGSGRIINISSVVGEMGNIGQANYAASKSGLFGLTKTLAREVAQQLGKADKLDEDGPGITVNTLAPGFIATDMTEDIPEKVIDSIKEGIPLGRLGRPDEIARVVHFLAADQSSYITGAIWAVNGGMDM